MKNNNIEVTYEQGLKRAKEYGLEEEYIDCINSGMSPQEACFEWDI